MKTSVKYSGTCSTLIKYHGSCNDGTTAAVLMKQLLMKKESENVVTAPATYGESSEFVDQYPGLDRIIYVDFTPSIETLKEILSMGFEVSIIDHHKTGEEALEKYIEEEGMHPNLDIIFDQNESGASLVYKGNEEILDDVFGPGLKEFVRLIKTRDLWMNEDKDKADALSYYLISNNYMKLTINLATTMIHSVTSEEGLVEKAVSEGIAITRYINMQSKETIQKNGVVKKVTDKDGNARPMVFIVTTEKVSDIAEVAKTMFGEGTITISLGYTRDGDLGLGFRSSGNISCRKLAEHLVSTGVLNNGGGHDYASGGDIKDFTSKEMTIHSLIDKISSSVSEVSLTFTE